MDTVIDPRPRLRASSQRWPVAGAISAASTLHAETAANETAAETADPLLTEGRARSKENRPAEVCQRFAQSDALKRTFGTAVNLGDCAGQNGYPGRAWQLYDDAAQRSLEGFGFIDTGATLGPHSADGSQGSPNGSTRAPCGRARKCNMKLEVARAVELLGLARQLMRSLTRWTFECHC
jgi:hypothetical protein